MSTTYGPSDSGVYYVTTSLGLGNSSVSIQYPLGTQIASIASVPTANIITTGGSTLSISALNFNSYVIVPGITVNIGFVAGVLASPTFYIGGDATITSLASAASAPVFDVYGGSLTLGSGLVAGLLGSTTINIGYNGTFSNGSGLISLLSGTTINFTTGGGTFLANAGGTLLNLSGLTINGFSTAVDKIEFENLASSLQSYTISTSGSSQIITLYSDASHSTEIGSVTVAGNALEDGTFVAGGSGPLTVGETNTGGEWNITIDVGASTVPCFLSGTLIATMDGEKPVETLQVGDYVLTHEGSAVPVRWIGRRTVSPRFADPLRVMPVRIREGAFGEHMPSRDLLVSPDHAVLIDHTLVNVGALVNGSTILRETGINGNFVYYHIEVDKHELIFAEGVLAETFIDHVDRMSFDNWAEHLQIFGEMPELPEMAYPRVKSARQLPYAIRAKLDGLAPAAARTAA